MDVKFRSDKDKKGNAYTYPIETKSKTKTSKPAPKPAPKKNAPKKTPAGFVRDSDGKLQKKRIVIKQAPKKPKKPKKAPLVKYMEKYIEILNDEMPLTQTNNWTAYISDKTAYEQSEEAIAMIKTAVKGSKVARNKRPSKTTQKTADETIADIYKAVDEKTPLGWTIL